MNHDREGRGVYIDDVIVRSPQHAEQERLTFRAFLTAHPSLSAMVDSWYQPDALFPDIVVILRGGQRVEFELGEWLDGPQMTRGIRRERLVAAIDGAIADQGENTCDHIRSVMLFLREPFPRFDPIDAAPFRAEV